MQKQRRAEQRQRCVLGVRFALLILIAEVSSAKVVCSRVSSTATHLPSRMLSGCRDVEAAQRTERWEAIWQSAEGHTVGATAAAVARFNALVSRACQLGASLRCMPF